MNTDAWFVVLAFCCAFVSAAAPDPSSWVTLAEDDAPRRQITAELFLNNGMDWGVWGEAEFCPEGSFAHAFEVKLEIYSATDDTAVNAVKLYCSTPAEHDTGYAMSTEGRFGDWMGESQRLGTEIVKEKERKKKKYCQASLSIRCCR
ncbi:vitelline membrane outer layer protein 1 homolog [Penaeus monodon]|uniref:vitelline membrane outer layer protein 1 homolog n=1 Tax=Penaeus monodon TaxID=6687 RepID=UPI0018A732F7|nr:vitelline membrane outer layer protein 1 homolog [Penaeus monodon]